MVKYWAIFLVIMFSGSLFASDNGVKVIDSLVDPTRPWGEVHIENITPHVKQKTNRMPNLQAIIKRSNQRIAIIDDNEIKEGYWVSEYKVKRITDDFVYLIRQDKEYRLSLFGTNVKY